MQLLIFARRRNLIKFAEFPFIFNIGTNIAYYYDVLIWVRIFANAYERWSFSGFKGGTGRKASDKTLWRRKDDG